MQHVLIWGNPLSGYQYAGPFASNEDAEKWAHEFLVGNLPVIARHWTAPLRNPTPPAPATS